MRSFPEIRRSLARIARAIGCAAVIAACIGQVEIVNPAIAGEAVLAEKGEICGGEAAIQCAGDLWCDPAPGLCAMPGAGGVCVEAAPFCTREYRPVCGCDGTTYGNDCDRKANLAALAHEGVCE